MANAKEKRTKRDNGQGTVYQRKDGRFECKVQIGKKDDGKPKFKSFYGKSEREVKKKLKEYQSEMAKNPVESSKETLANYMYDWLITFKQKTLKPSSYDRLLNVYKYHVKETVGYMQLCNINSKDVQQLINEKSETMSYSSVKKIYELLNNCFTYAVIEEDIRKNPMLGVSLPKQSNMNIKTKKIEIYTKEEVEKLTNAIYNDTFNSKRQLYRYSPIYIFILNTGLRVGEVLALKWENIDLENKVVRVNGSMSFIKDTENEGKRKTIFTDPKTATSNRSIPLNEKSVMALTELKRRNQIQNIKSKYVVCDLKGGHVPQRNISRTLQNLCEKASVDYKGIHAMRHTFATNLVANGVDIRSVSDLLGHASIQTTLSTYSHSIQEQKVKAISSLDLI